MLGDFDVRGVVGGVTLVVDLAVPDGEARVDDDVVVPGNGAGVCEGDGLKFNEES